jgi:murein DD-endopeptidase MepM/ murein hydrolase activator NlpD
MSSGFGMRRHPIQGYNKMHKGVDFAASSGTPIYAAGDGVIEQAGRKGGYGNYIRIRHNNQLKTAYAHMSRFAKGMSTGRRVRQGEIIGYVGTTGASTGPHLHYEVMLNGVQVNPRGVNLPIGEVLEGEQLRIFQAHARDIDRTRNSGRMVKMAATKADQQAVTALR